LREQIITPARLQGNERVLDIGAGTGLLTIAVAPRVAHVVAVDTSPAMCRHLETELARRSIDNADVLLGSASELPLADNSVDLVVSNYCFHHLNDEDKHRALAEAIRVLRPNGRLAVGDMMFQIGFRDARDRAVIVRFTGKMLRRGPAGMLRIVKNAIRLLTGRGEHPASLEWWRRALHRAGFDEIRAQGLEHEGGIATARRPEPSPPHATRRGRPPAHQKASSRPPASQAPAANR
jgi:ubiquinone/menaquinone biosynthesis C-methylase UbiE